MKESDIRPQSIFDEYLRLATADTQAYFHDAPREHINCPACNTLGEPAFDKEGFHYALCPACATLFVSPRPAPSAFARYYTEAPSVEYWATTFYRTTADARREKLWRPKAEMIHSVLGDSGHSVIDIGGGFGIFAEEFESLTGKRVTIVEPGPALADECRSRGLSVVQKFLEGVDSSELPAGHRAFVSFELFEHLHDPADFLRSVRSLMQPDDVFVFTTLSGTGVDILALWENSKSVFPPHHLNFLNPGSVSLLLDRVGFSDVVVTTPGKLDIDILANNKHLIKDGFWKVFIEQSTAAARQQWQAVIAESGWSSHMMVVSRL